MGNNNSERLWMEGGEGTPFPFRIRQMKLQDIRDVMAIEQSSFPSPWPESAYQYELRYRKNSQFFVLQPSREQALELSWRDRLLSPLQMLKEPAILGYVGVRHLERAAHICTIAVHPDWRQRGFGEFLLLTALVKAWYHGARKVTLEVRPSNRAAQQLYHKVGFVQTSVRSMYYRDGEDAWMMMLESLDGPTIRHLQDLFGEVKHRLQQQARRSELEWVGEEG